jgi:hypothetical protein
MSTRERWIVYPLLLLTLGIVMRDKIVGPTHLKTGEVTAGQIRCNQLMADQMVMAGQIRCGQLQADQALCKRLQSAGAVAATAVQCGEVVVIGPNGRPTVVLGTDQRTKGGVIGTFSASGAPQFCVPPIGAGATKSTSPEKDKGSPPEKSQSPSSKQERRSDEPAR